MNNYNLKAIVDSIDDRELREFICSNLMYDANLLNKFRVEFSSYFPKLTKENYKNKIYSAISSCGDRHGYIDYNNTHLYSYAMHAMYEYIHEAKKSLNDNVFC